ncbi:MULTISPECIES: serine/threonine-protein kinase [unclassified Okeania]|nr:MULTISPECIES: serine/threonine-protein kinase [unclassified Okeania]NES78429.1 serine/threonine protein kinase [Okeania sp. SIO1H4]NET15502.1 serine/threonine protein kinase [Okeania sp. SIO1H6]NET21729.1 serine/threonine protein kinase [Okeania sp. SIO1H5]NET96052.1 serine/threonine protein kinase [Okeania sp. SIO1H2]
MLTPGKILKERYQLQKQLGNTVAGRKTWLAFDSQLQEQVTLKMLAYSPELLGQELNLFETEAKTLQALNHPHIPRYRDYFSLEKSANSDLPWFALVQDYIPGFSLQELLDREKNFTEEDVRKIAKEVLEILIYLHELEPPVLHRDIKPSNLIMGADQQIYLVDFGAVQSQGNAQGVTFTIIGTSGYAPLEQFWGRAVPASDLYALGATLIHLLTGIFPVDLPQKNYQIQFTDKVDINPSFATWISKITEMDLGGRFQNAREALTSLDSKSKLQPLVTPQKNPLNFSIIITVNKSPDMIEIYTHAPSLRELKDSGIIGGALCIFFGLLLTNPIYGILFLIIIFVGIYILFGEKKYIYIDRNSFQVERHLFNFIYGKCQGNTRDILQVLSSKFESGYQVTIQSQIDKYQLDRAMNPKDSTRLAQEINEWLNQKPD